MSVPRYVLYHANCPDGFGSAYAAWKKFGEGTHYVPVTHGAPPPEFKSHSEIFIIDFAYDRDTLLAMNQEHSVKVLDHHKTAQADLEGLDFAEFDMNRSGAVMAWNHFHPDTDVPMLLQYVQDQDLWNWELPDSQAVCTGLSMHPMDFETWDALEIESLKNEGQLVLQYKEQLMQRLLRKIDWLEICGHVVPAINTPLFASELGNTLCLEYPDAAFAACYSEHEGMRKFSLRSVGDSDVATIAKKFGGGGHQNAAGFAVESSGHPEISTAEPPPEQA